MTTKPVLFSVDDDPDVLRAVTRDLRRHYGSDYRIMRADSGTAALNALQQLKQRNDPVALLLVDQRMPRMSGIEFISEAMSLYPDAKRVLLTAYADTDAAISAINTAAIHYYLLKPWDPPEEKLYPVLDDLLEEWQSGYHPPFQGIRVVGHRWSTETYELKDFLARNQVPYQYLDLELNGESREVLDQFAISEPELPFVILSDGKSLSAPTIPEVAEQIGLSQRAGQTFYDLVIVGGGPAGLAAAVYGASEGLNTVLIEREAPGGQAGTSSRIENYLGFPSGLSGADLARRAATQARRFGVEILAPQEAIGVRINGQYRIVELSDGSEISCHALIVAVGLAYRKLDVPGVEALTGAGIYYGASLTEVLTCQDRPAFIVGAGNSAGQAALYLAHYASQVTLLVRGGSLESKMSQYLVERIYDHPKIDVQVNHVVTAAHGDAHLEGLTLYSEESGQEHREEAAALFIFIGATPATEWLEGVVEMDQRGFIYAGPDLARKGELPAGWSLERSPMLPESSVPGLFVVGDVRANSVKRVASAVGEGSIAVRFVHQYLERL